MKYDVWIDGSYSQWEKIAGCSYLILTADTYISSATVTKTDITSASIAETYSVGLAARYILNNIKTLQPDDVVEFNIDCGSTVSICQNYVGEDNFIRIKNKQVVNSILTLRNLRDKCKVRFKKIRGHKDNINPNTFVDRLSKIAIRRE